jgi:capsular polysaccharide biosynthesis protein
VVRLQELDKRIELTEELYRQTRQDQAQAQVAGAITPDWTAELLVPAGMAARVNRLDYIRIALAPLLALAVSIGLAFFVDSLDHSLKSVREVEDALGLKVVASVPEVK